MPNLNQALPPLLAPLDKDEILAYLKELKPALQKDGIIELGLFGSYAKGTASASSDIDIFIRTSDEFHKKFSGFKYFAYLDDIATSIQKRFGVDSVDVCNIKYFNSKKIDPKIFFKGAIYV